LQQIEEFAFYASGLRTIVIPSSVAHLYKSCFSHCLSLASISFETRSNLEQIESGAFASCPHLQRINFLPSTHHIDPFVGMKWMIHCPRIETLGCVVAFDSE
jgi:hypothetical protein